MGTLQKIIESKHSELNTLRTSLPRSSYTPRPFSLRREDHLHLMCEIKFRSPSAGDLSTALSVEDRAKTYTLGGASLISVLVDAPFFGGAWQNLTKAREACDTPLLAKEFVLDECQLDAAVAYGADAVLLIVRCLTKSKLEELHAGAVTRGLMPLVEVNTEAELATALNVGAQVIGVNARNLDTLQMDAEQATRVLQQIPPTHTALYLSGTREAKDVAEHATSRADGVLIGECLMRRDDPLPLLQEFARNASIR